MDWDAGDRGEYYEGTTSSPCNSHEQLQEEDDGDCYDVPDPDSSGGAKWINVGSAGKKTKRQSSVCPMANNTSPKNHSQEIHGCGKSSPKSSYGEEYPGMVRARRFVNMAEWDEYEKIPTYMNVSPFALMRTPWQV